MKISKKIGTFSIVIAIVPIMVIGMAGYKKTANLLVDHQVENASNYLEQTEEKISQKLEGTEKNVSMLVRNIKNLGIENGFKTFEAVASNYSDYMYAYVGIEETGEFLISPKTEMPEGFDPRKRPWYGIAKDSNPVVSEPYVDAASGEVIITVSQAVFKDGKRIGVVGIDLDLNLISKQITKIKIGETGYIFVLYKDGKALVHPDQKLIGVDLTEKLDFVKQMLEMKSGLFEYNYKGEKFAALRTIDKYGWTLGAGTYYSEMKEPLVPIRNLTLIVGIITLSIVFAGIVFTTRSITKPLNKVVDGLRDAAEGDGDLTKRIDVSSKDEIGELAVWFNAFVDKLQGIITEITENANLVDISSKELSVVAEQMASNVEQTAERSNNVTVASGEMSSNMSSVAAATEQTAANIQTIVAAIEEMSSTINEIAGNTAKGSQTTAMAVGAAKDVSKKVDDLGKAALEISKVTDTISEISDQTNLLALNATIEAARAGDAGKGFAVVAGEIKALAQQTAEATNEISSKIDGVQTSTRESVAAIESIVNIINEINEIVTVVATAIEEQSSTTREISSNISQAASGVNEVNENVNQVSSVVAEVNMDISKVNQATDEVKSGGVQVASSAAQLAGLSESLKKMVSQFVVETHSSAAGDVPENMSQRFKSIPQTSDDIVQSTAAGNAGIGEKAKRTAKAA